MTKKRIHLIYSILLSATLVVSGLCLIDGCIGIYRSGYRAFSREAVATAFAAIDIPIYLTLVLILGGIIFDVFFPGEKVKKVPQKQYSAMLSRLLAKVDITYCPPHLLQQILTLRNRRRLVCIHCLCLLVLCSGVFLVFTLNWRAYPDSHELNSFMIKSMYVFIPCLAVPFSGGIFAAYYNRRSICREIELVKQAIADGCPAPATAVAPPAPVSPATMTAVKCVVAGIALGLFLYGLFSGGFADVQTKAVAICTECVGLG